MPNLVVLFLLSTFWFAGIDPVVEPEEDHRKNLKKYLQVQRKITDNYVKPVDLNKLYKSSVKGLVKNLSDSTMELAGTPLDTTFTDTTVSISDIRDAYTRFEDAYLYLSSHKPDENLTRRTEDAIRNMLADLDPHSVYIEPKEGERIEAEFEGKFEGIGIQFDIIKDTITVVTPITGGPSEQLGIQSGDRIVKINDSSAVGYTQDKVINTLRGPKGSEVKVTVKRPRTNELLNFNITRDEIPMHTVDTSYMIDDSTGYIKINRFAASTHEEFMSAMEELKGKGMGQLILDLRRNPGGYLSQAIAIAEEFFEKNTKIVSTNSRHPRFQSVYHSRREGTFLEKPLMILVNEGSASASEIVSGAVQDHDRGLIVGRRTFGKGLVQQQYPLVDSSKIRVTISRYYTPSGRLIQKPYQDKNRREYAYETFKREDNASVDVREFINQVPDSLKYKTDAGRTVYGGGGIIPDHIIQQDTTESAAIYNLMRRKRLGFDFVQRFLSNKDESFKNEWEDQFDKFVDEYKWDNEQITEFHQVLLDNGLVESDTVDSARYQSDTLYVSRDLWEKSQWMALGYMKADLARQIWGLERYYQVYNHELDRTLDKSMKLWDEVRELHKLAMSKDSSRSPSTSKAYN